MRPGHGKNNNNNYDDDDDNDKREDKEKDEILEPGPPLESPPVSCTTHFEAFQNCSRLPNWWDQKMAIPVGNA